MRKLFFLILATICAARAASPAKILLKDHWTLQSSCEVQSAGAEISRAGFNTEGWHKADVPSTVVGALVADKTYPDPYVGTNLRSFPGMNYKVGALFSNLPMPDTSPFRCSWWYRTEFPLPASKERETTRLRFDGINYRANVWLNGQKVADAKDVAGPFREFEFDVSKVVQTGVSNALAVEVFAPEKDSLAITWVDWNPAPPDKDMGLWKDVYLTESGPVSLRHAFVNPKLDGEYRTADLSVSVELRNASDHQVEGTLKAEIGGIKVTQRVELGASEEKTARFEVKLKNPKLWWPYQMGPQNLYGAELEFESGGHVSDRASVRFGIREVKSELTDKGVLLFRVNGKKVLIRGAAWTFRYAAALVWEKGGGGA